MFDSFEGTNMILKEYIKEDIKDKSQKEQKSQNKIYITPYRKGN